jgi:hypothetical protein
MSVKDPRSAESSKNPPASGGYVTVEISNVGMAPCGIDEANSRMYSTSACSGMGRNTCDEGGSVTKTTDDPGAAYSWGWGGSLVVSSSISAWGTLENKNFSLWAACTNQGILILTRQTLRRFPTQLSCATRVFGIGHPVDGD